MTDDDESKRTILSRRARFIAAALASASLAANAACESEAEPQPCLSMYYGGAGGTDGGPGGNDGSGGLGGLGGLGGGPSDASNEGDKPPIDATDA